jgi:hypothetical protein
MTTDAAEFIEFRALTKIFDVPVIDPLDLTISEGEFVVFVGPRHAPAGGDRPNACRQPARAADG